MRGSAATSGLKRLIESVLSLFIPPKCASCGTVLSHESVFCESCKDTFRLVEEPFCSICGLPFKSSEGSNHPCPSCWNESVWFDRARAVFIYEGAIRRAIHRFKYHANLFQARILGGLLADVVEDLSGSSSWDFIVPVPLHETKLKQRGFNQALLLSRYVAKRVGIPLDVDTLRRTRVTRPQVELSGSERMKNVRNAFEVNSPEVCNNKQILLLDDVFTTGATMRECARVLKKAGASRVDAVTLARSVEWHLKW